VSLASNWDFLLAVVKIGEDLYVGCSLVTAQLTLVHASTLVHQVSSTWLSKDSGSSGSASPGSRINTPLVGLEHKDLSNRSLLQTMS
jgi:hypothetical protein